MSSRSGSRPRTRGNKQVLVSSAATASTTNNGSVVSSGRPATRSKQRGYYSETAGLHAAEAIGVSLIAVFGV